MQLLCELQVKPLTNLCLLFETLNNTILRSFGVSPLGKEEISQLLVIPRMSSVLVLILALDAGIEYVRNQSI
jgi:hypothetical protein